MTSFLKSMRWVFLLIFVSIVQARAHGISYPVIVDTDMALDDMRAITMLLNAGEADIPLIVTSDGITSPQQGVDNLRAILQYFQKTDIIVATGRKLDKDLPECREWMKDIHVPGYDRDSDIEVPSAEEAIVKTVSAIYEPIIYVCLGPLTNLADALETQPDIQDHISAILYFGGDPVGPVPGWNTLRDPESAQKVFESGIRIYAMAFADKELLPFDKDFFNRICELRTPSSRLIEVIHKTPEIRKRMAENRFRIWDEMTAIYISQPSLFTFVTCEGDEKIMTLRSFDQKGVSEAYLQMMGLEADVHLSVRQSVVLRHFPREPSAFREDLAPYVDGIIKTYGLEEWKACLLTNEFHRHLGIYSLVGAKMGVRAREMLEAPFDTLKVISRAGTRPPLSCMNDGLQVSTGASLGRGTIKMFDQQPLIPGAVFVYGDIKLDLRLKHEIRQKIQKDVSALIKQFGGTTPEYFAQVRKLAIQYWIDLDRGKIFEETMIKKTFGENEE